MENLHEVAFHLPVLGALPPDPWDFSLSGRNKGERKHTSPPLIPAPETALGLRPRSALSSAQAFPEWTTSTPPCNDFSSNGDFPLNGVSHSRGSVQSRPSPRSPAFPQCAASTILLINCFGTPQAVPVEPPGRALYVTVPPMV